MCGRRRWKNIVLQRTKLEAQVTVNNIIIVFNDLDTIILNHPWNNRV